MYSHLRSSLSLGGQLHRREESSIIFVFLMYHVHLNFFYNLHLVQYLDVLFKGRHSGGYSVWVINSFDFCFLVDGVFSNLFALVVGL